MATPRSSALQAGKISSTIRPNFQVVSALEESTHIPFTNMTGICVIELPKVNPEKKPIGKLTKLELCLEYLRHADEEGSEYQDALIRLGGKELEIENL
ncbi:MAG: hypothetical protein HFE76_01005 [Firmicutes bacterium]|nr:hypothetical protein [Bacillota bacterium]